MEPDEANQVVSDVAELASAAASAEVAAHVLDDVIEAANERVEAAEETAERIAEAAMESARGHEIEAIRKDTEKWQEENLKAHSELWEAVRTIQATLAEMSGQVSALALLEISDRTQLSSIQPPSAEAAAEAMETITEVIPEQLASAVEESPAVPPVEKRRRWI